MSNSFELHSSGSVLPHLFFLSTPVICISPVVDCFHTYNDDNMQYAPGTLKHKRKSVYTHSTMHTHIHITKLLHAQTLSQNQSAWPGISHSSVPCLFPLWLRWLRIGRPDTEPSHRDTEQWWQMNTCKRQSKCSFITTNSIWEMDVCPPTHAFPQH